MGKVSPTFPAALFSIDARFAGKIERPQKGTKELMRQNKRKQMKQQVLNIISTAKKPCKYVAPSSYKLFKKSKFFKISDNSSKNQNTFREGCDNKFYIKFFRIYPTNDL